jgi:SP family arabinose:H+ symporter-like MFS transporter
MQQRSSYIIFISFTAAIGGFLLGFDGSVISGAVPFYKTIFDLKDGSFMLGFSVSCIIWGAILGNLLAGPLSDRIGRKPSLLLSALLFTATGIMCSFANNIEVFISGRIIGGIGVGIAILVAPIYIAEIAPARKRGWLVSFNQLLIVFGLTAAYFSNYFILKTILDPLTNWRWMLGVEILPAIIYFITLLWIPESPRWLIMQGHDIKALAIMTRVEGSTYAAKEYNEIKNTISSEKKIGLGTQLKELFAKKMKLILIIGFGLGILQQFSGINAILYYAPMVFESAGGGRDAAFLQAIVLGVVFIIMTIVSMFLIDRLGRKPLLYIGVSLMAISLSFTGVLFKNATYQINQAQINSAAAAVYKNELWLNASRQNPALLGFDDFSISNNIAYFKKDQIIVSSVDLGEAEIIDITNENKINIERLSQIRNHPYNGEIDFFRAIENSISGKKSSSDQYKPLLLKDGIKINAMLVLISILGFIAGFSISLGPVMWAMLSEIFPNKLRGIAISVVGAANAVSSFLVATFFPIQLAKFGSSGTYFIYAGFMFFCVWFIWKYVVETKGKSLEQLEKELIKNE